MEALCNYKSTIYSYYNIYKLQISTSIIEFDKGICKKCQSDEEFENLIRTAVNKSSFCFFLTNVLYFINNSTSEKYLVFSKEYLNYKPINVPINVPIGINNVNNVMDVMVVFKNYLPLILKIHSNKFIHYDISINSLIHLQDYKYSLQYSLQYSEKIVSFSNFLTKSPIIGSNIISPLHLIIEMMYSRLETNIIPLSEFKHKFIKFYNILSSEKKNAQITPFKTLIEFCQYYFSMRYGAIDYTDYLINKLCIVINNNTVKKDSSKALNYKKYVDLFAFSVILHSLLPLNYDRNVQDSKTIKNFIISTVAFEDFE